MQDNENRWAFVEHVTQQLLRPRPGDSKHPTLWPSEASAVFTDEYGDEVVVGKCRRAIFYRYLIECYKFYPKFAVWQPLVERLECERRTPDKYMLWIWSAGELYEEYLINKAKESGVFVSEQAPVYVKTHNISGKRDIEVFNPSTGKLSIVEAKSVYGFGANRVLGSPGDRSRGIMGVPRESNLMQIAIYHWWSASEDPAYEESRLVYGARDTGRYAEYLIRTVIEEDTIWVEYKPHHPHPGEWVRTDITINSILEQYAYIQRCIDGGEIPEADFQLVWDEARLETMYQRGELGKTDSAQYEKAKARIEYNLWVDAALNLAQDPDSKIDTVANWAEKNLIADRKANAPRFIEEVPVAVERAFFEFQADDDKAEVFVKSLLKLKPKRSLKQIEKGDWQCRFCKWQTTCHGKSSET